MKSLSIKAIILFVLCSTPQLGYSQLIGGLITKRSGPRGDIVLKSISPYFVASVYDNNYTPYAAPTGPANLTTGTNPDGTAENLINIQGVITTTGVTVSIPYTVTTSPVTLPAYTQTITVPSGSTEDGYGRNLTFSYPATGSLPVGSGTITATLQAVGGTLNAKKLDVQTGIGNDNLGYLLGQFTYATNSSGGTANFAVRIISGIPDRNFANAQHVMLYLPIVSATGRTWLNNSLGADYSNTAKANFNPGQQGTSAKDYNAYGSLYQWGRYSDGHELITWTSSSTYTRVYGTTATTSDTDTPSNGLFITSAGDWRSTPNETLWQGLYGVNNPCPSGFRLPSRVEFDAEFSTYSITDEAAGYNSVHKYTSSGYSTSTDGNEAGVGSFGIYWIGAPKASPSVGEGDNKWIGQTGAAGGVRARGFSVRCISGN